MIVNWEVDDGYVGSGTQETEISDDDIRECETIEDAMRFVEDEVQRDFEQKISWNFKMNNLESEVLEILENRE